MRLFIATLILILLGGCTGLPDNAFPVKDFDTNKYLGKWYEIARLDHSFERGMDKVSAEYTFRDDGGLRVINKGYSAENNKWNETEGW